MAKISLNSVDRSIFGVRANGSTGIEEQRSNAVALGRLLFYDYASRGQDAVCKALSRSDAPADRQLAKGQYTQVNKRFQEEHLLYCAKVVCLQTGSQPPADFETFKKQGQNYYHNSAFLATLQGVYQEIVTPILPAVYSEAVSTFADVVEVGFAETFTVSVGSNDIPVFQDSAWGASRSVPANRFYSKDYTLNPQPKTAEMRAKWHQLVGNNMDFGRFFANIVAGMYAKTMGMWNQMMTAAATNPALIPTGLTTTFNSTNWVTLANKLAAVNNTAYGNIFAFGSAVALSKVLPTQATGSTNVNMDAALAVLLGDEYIRSGYLGEFMNVALRPLTDVVIPGTQNGDVATMLSPNQIWMMAGNGRKPVTIGYNRDTPITIEVRPELTSSFELIFNMTIALEAVAVFSSRVGLVTI